MVYVIRPIDIVSPSNGKTYTSRIQYERDLERVGQHIMTDKQYRETRERLIDESKTPAPKKSDHNHVHIDFANGRVETSKKDIDV